MSPLIESTIFTDLACKHNVSDVLTLIRLCKCSNLNIHEEIQEHPKDFHKHQERVPLKGTL